MGHLLINKRGQYFVFDKMPMYDADNDQYYYELYYMNGRPVGARNYGVQISPSSLGTHLQDLTVDDKPATI